MRKSIVLAADNAYLIPLETTIKSVLYHNRDVDFYILNSDIAPEWFKLLGRKMEVVNSTIRSVHIDKELFESYKTGPHINYASYFRFFATEVVESDRVLYLDSDIIVTGELATLFEIDLKGYSIGAVDDVYAYEGRKSGFNTGMLLMDVVKWKEHSIVNSLLELAAEQNQVVHLGDQSILNIYFEDNWLALDKTYNYMVGVDIYHLAQECERLDDNPPTIVHYASHDKPWNTYSISRLRELGKYLVECVEHILKQTYQNIEIILVDDSSTDNSGEICDAFMMQDNRVRVLHQENKGGAAQAKNMGISVAKGEYITIVDSDDIVKENMIETLYQQVQEKDADVVIGNYYNYDESDGNFYFYVTGKDFCVEELAIQEIMNRQAGDWKFNSSAFILPTFKLIKKELFNEVHFSNGRRFDDEATMHRFYLLASKIVFINDNLYLYRRRSGSIMRTEFDLSWARDIVEVFSKKISDCVLAGLDVSVLRIRFVNLLKDYKQTLEYHQLTDTEEYKDICFRLKLFFDAEQRNGKS